MERSSILVHCWWKGEKCVWAALLNLYDLFFDYCCGLFDTNFKLLDSASTPFTAIGGLQTTFSLIQNSNFNIPIIKKKKKTETIVF